MEKSKELTVGDYIIIARALDGKRKTDEILREIGQDKIDQYYAYQGTFQSKKESKDLTDEEMIITKEDMLSSTLEDEFMVKRRMGQDYPQYLECRIKEYTSELIRLLKSNK